MTPEEYWHSEGVRLLNEDGTIPSGEQRVKRGYEIGRVDGFASALHIEREEIERELMGRAFTKAARLLREHNRRNGK